MGMDMILGGININDALRMVAIAAAIFICLNLVLWAMLLAYTKLPDCWLKKRLLYPILHAVDEKADELETPVAKQKTVYDLQLMLAWTRKFVPQPVIAMAIDLELKAIRTMQEATGCPDLHVAEKTEAVQTDSQSDNMRV